MIALALICKGEGDESKLLERALKSVAHNVDKVFITITGDRVKAKKARFIAQNYNAEISYGQFFWEAKQEDVDKLKDLLGWQPDLKAGDKLFQFDEARNYNFAQIPKEYEWIMWMDTDDIIQGSENLHNLADTGIEKNIEAFYFEYLYQVEYEQEGNNIQINNVIIKHLRERLVRNIGIYKWIAPIHETLIEQRPSNKTDTQEVKVIHLATEADRRDSLQRNLKNLELAILRSEGKDPRHIYYLAKAYFDINDKEHDDRAIKLIEKYLHGENPSGWPEERAQAWTYLSDIYKRKGELNNSVKSCMNSLIEIPDIPATYLNLASSYMHKKQWEQALFWARMSSNVPEKKTTLVVNPKDDQGRMLEILYNCSLNLGRINDAWAAAVKLQELYPDDPNMSNTLAFINNLKIEKELTEKYTYISTFLKNMNERPKLKALLDSWPQALKDNPFYLKMMQDNMPPKYWGSKDIAIYCGPGFTNWSPVTLTNPGDNFCGGSEEAVIRMSQELQKIGWNVTVYSDPGMDEGMHDGVNWLPYYKFNRADSFNILINWRDIRFFDSDFKAKKKYIWLHDSQQPIEWTPERIERIDKAIFLSQWQRDNVPLLPDEKVIISSNGI